MFLQLFASTQPSDANGSFSIIDQGSSPSHVTLQDRQGDLFQWAGL